MGCCGSGSGANVNQLNALRASGPPVETGYALDMPDGRTFTYLTRPEAEAARDAFHLDVEIRPVLGWN